MEKFFVYFLVFERMFKAGKTKNPKSRLKQLIKTYGPITWETSFLVEVVSEQESFNLESSIHKTFSSFSVDLDNQDGYTEFFTLEALDHVKSFIKFYENINTNKIINNYVPITENILLGTKKRFNTKPKKRDDSYLSIHIQSQIQSVLKFKDAIMYCIQFNHTYEAKFFDVQIITDKKSKNVLEINLINTSDIMVPYNEFPPRKLNYCYYTKSEYLTSAQFYINIERWVYKHAHLLIKGL